MHIHPLRLYAAVVALVIALMAMTGCRRGPVEARLDLADSLMESRPDSALTILDSISAADLRGDAQKARHALLLSMALDKNYIDTTTFDVLQPAIDYYPRHGSPDEKLRTYYYQGRIYQNRSEYNDAMLRFLDGYECFSKASDTLTMANLLVAYGSILYSKYNTDGYIRSNLEAARLYNSLGRKNYEMDCLAMVLNGSIINGNKVLADSVLNEVEICADGNSELESIITPYVLAYIAEFGNKEEILEILEQYNTADSIQSVTDIDIMNIAWSYYKIGDIQSAQSCLDSLSPTDGVRASLKYLALQPDILEANGDFEGALKAYRLYLGLIDSLHFDIFSQDLNFANTRHKIEMDSLVALQHKDKLIWLSICIALGLIAITVFVYYRYRISRAKILIEKHENDKLQKENERLTLEKRNAELERESQVLASENLRLRIEQLEEESVRLNEILSHHTSLEKPIEDAIKERIGMLNEMLASRISRTGTATVSYEEWIDRIVADKDAFMNSTRLAFKATHPKFMEYLEDHELTDTEINYVCLYAIGLRGKEVGEYIRSSRHYHLSSDIRRKLGIDGHQTNIGIYIRKLMTEFDN